MKQSAEFSCPADVGQHFLSVAHITEDDMEFITPDKVTDSHAIVNISSFSCFGLVTSQANSRAIRCLVLLFSQPSTNSLFVLLLPHNVCLTEVGEPSSWTQLLSVSSKNLICVIVIFITLVLIDNRHFI